MLFPEMLHFHIMSLENLVVLKLGSCKQKAGTDRGALNG